MNVLIASAEAAFVTALRRFIGTTSCPKYLRDAAEAWLKEREAR